MTATNMCSNFVVSGVVFPPFKIIYQYCAGFKTTECHFLYQKRAHTERNLMSYKSSSWWPAILCNLKRKQYNILVYRILNGKVV